MKEIDFSKANANDFTQKDLMLHLLQVSQHTVTREELKEDIANVDKSISKLETNLKEDISKLETTILKVETGLKEDMLKLETTISKVETNLKEDISKVEVSVSKLESKFDRLQWFLVVGALVILFKEQILKFIQ